MRFKFFALIGLVLALSSGAFAFEVYDSQGDVGRYFSLGTDDVKIKSDNNLSEVSIDYMVSGSNFSKNFAFESCLDEFCAEVSLGDLILDEGGVLSDLEEFNISVAQENISVYLDIEKPSFDYINYYIDAKSEAISFNYSYSDNSGKLGKVELYKKFGDDLIFVADLKNKSSYNISVDGSGNFIYIFRVYDSAGNMRSKEEVVSVGDIFSPVIDDLFIILKESDYKLSFDISDDNLSRYEIIQDNLLLSEDISSSNYAKTINLPFKGGEIIFRVVDERGNSVNETLSLRSPISIDYDMKFSNQKEFNFKSNANSCYLTNIDSKSYSDREFLKDSNRFSKTLEVSDIGEYEIGFYCQNEIFREYFLREFYYDTQKPSEIDIALSANQDGGVDVSWDESVDEESDVKYRLYREDSLIYEGRAESFEDSYAKYPNSYSYYVEALDEAGNSVESAEATIIPKKVLVNFESSLKDSETESSQVSFDIVTDMYSDVKISIVNSGSTIKEEFFENISSRELNLDYALEEGENVVSIFVEDEFGNEMREDFSIVYNDPLLSENENQEENEVVVEQKEDVIEPSENESSNVTKGPGATKGGDEGGFLNWIWFIILLALFVVFIKYFIIDEDKISFIRKNEGRRKGGERRFPKKKTKAYAHKRVKDYALEKDFNRIKQERIKKQQERLEEIERLKRLEEKSRSRSELSQKKMEDLAEGKEIFIPPIKREERKSSAKKVRSSKDYDSDVLDEKRKDESPKGDDGMFSFLKGKTIKEDEVKDDELSNYLRRVKEAPSWSSTRDYVYKEPASEPAPEEVKSEKYEGSLENKRSIEKEKSLKNGERRRFSLFKGINEREGGNANKTSSYGARNDSVEGDKSSSEGNTDVSSQEDTSSSKKAAKIDLDDYLNKRFKNKRRNLFFAEKSVDRDLKNRED